MTNTADNPRTTGRPDEPRSEVLSRAYREAVDNAGAEPPQSLDDAIRAAALRAVQARPLSVETARSRSGFRRWQAPLALAATLLLAVGVAVRVYNTREVELAPAGAPTATQSVQEEPVAKEKAEKFRPKPENERRADETIGTPLRRDAARSRQEKPIRGEEIGGTTGKPGAGSETAPEPKTDTQAERREAQPALKPFPGAPNAVPAPRAVDEPVAVPRAQVPAESAEAPAVYPSRSPPLRRFERQAEKEKSLGAPPSALSLAQRLEGHAPEVWIEEIRALKRAGRSTEAAELLAVFSKKFPNFALPDDLR
jgi:hypothetical protein